MHRLIMNPSPAVQVDHINHNHLDNRRSNLRLCRNAENHWNTKVPKSNTSGYRGVCFVKRLNKWQAKVNKNGKQYHVGLYATPEDAARAYNARAKELYGDFAYLNYIPEDN